MNKELERIKKQELAKKRQQAKVLETKKRYQVYRNMGYNAKVSRSMSQRKTLNVTKIKLNDKGKIIDDTINYESLKQKYKPSKTDLNRINKSNNKLKDTREKRYQVYKKLGYDSKTSRALSRRALKVDTLELNKKGQLKDNATTKKYIATDMKEWKNSIAVDSYRERTKSIDKDTNFSRWGMLTHDKRYKGENGKIVSIVKNQHNLTSDQAYYFTYVMLQGNMSYEQAQNQLLSNREFEVYVSGKAKKKDEIKQSLFIRKDLI